MARSCPWCCEPLGRARQNECPHCGRVLVDDTGRELRDIDVRYTNTEEAQCERYRQFILIGVPVVAVAALAMPFLHFGAIAAAPLLAVIHLVAARWYLVGDSFRLLGRTRRQFNRWLARFSFLWLGVPGYAAMVTPILGILVGVATFAGLSSVVHLYARWSLEQEYRRLPLLTWEKTLITVLAVATLLVLAALLALAGVMGWSVAALSEWISSDPG